MRHFSHNVLFLYSVCLHPLPFYYLFGFDIFKLIYVNSYKIKIFRFFCHICNCFSESSLSVFIQKLIAVNRSNTFLSVML